MYKLTENHYDNLSYLIPELHEDNIYHLNKDPLIQDFNIDIIIKVLDYYNNGNLDFINKDNYKECFAIFLHFGSKIGILFDYYNGIVIKKLNVLKDINLINNSSKEDYGLVVQFNRDIYNYQNKLKYQKLFYFYFNILDLNLDILDYDNYKIDYVKVSNKKELENYRDYYKIEICFDEEINVNEFSNNLTHLLFAKDNYCNFNQEIKENVLPQSLTHLTFYGNFNQEIKENVLPQSLTHITFGGYFNQEIKQNILPQSLIHLTFGWNFNQEIKENVLPQSLKHLTFGRKSLFNQEIKENVLPQSLTHLTFDNYCKFSQEIKVNVLPQSLKHLAFYNNFNKEIKKNVLPESLTHLTFGKYCKFNQEIKENVLSQSLTHLTFGYEFNKEIKENVLPNSLTHLTFCCYYKNIIKKNVLPQSLTHLILNNYYQKIMPNVLPKKLIQLTLVKGYLIEQTFDKDVLPDSLQDLIFTDEDEFNYEKKLSFIPKSLNSITFNESIFLLKN
jgi:hypothetical protein